MQPTSYTIPKRQPSTSIFEKQGRIYSEYDLIRWKIEISAFTNKPG